MVGLFGAGPAHQLKTLEEAGHVESVKDRSARRSRSVRLTEQGRAAFDTYLRALEQLVARSRGTGPHEA